MKPTKSNKIVWMNNEIKSKNFLTGPARCNGNFNIKSTILFNLLMLIIKRLMPIVDDQHNFNIKINFFFILCKLKHLLMIYTKRKHFFYIRTRNIYFNCEIFDLVRVLIGSLDVSLSLSFAFSVSVLLSPLLFIPLSTFHFYPAAVVFFYHFQRNLKNCLYNRQRWFSSGPMVKVKLIVCCCLIV